MDKPTLSRDRIEVAALDLIEGEGLTAFSTRKLAARLGCEAMSIYHYFPSKGHLMDALVDRVIGNELSVPANGGGSWRDQVERAAYEWRGMALRHPAFFSYIALHRLNTPTALRWLDGMLAVMGRSGLSQELGVRAFRLIGYYLTGAMSDETAGYSRGPSAVEQVSDETMQHDFPRVVAASHWFAEEQRQATFDLGLNLLLDGIERQISPAGQ